MSELQPEDELTKVNQRQPPMIVVWILSGATIAVSGLMAVIEAAFLWKTSENPAMNEGNPGCVWFLASVPLVFSGYFIGGIGAVASLIALFLAIRWRSTWWMAAVLGLLAAAGLIALSWYGHTHVLKL